MSNQVIAASFCLIALALGCTDNAPQSMPPSANHGGSSQREVDDLIENLRNHPLTDGFSAGGPYWGIGKDDVTRPIIARGMAIVPRLVGELPHSSWAESVYIVFCLSELKAKSAKANVLELQAQVKSGRFAHEGRNFTLDMQITYYLRDWDSW